jgi:hypothetical protein
VTNSRWVHGVAESAGYEFVERRRMETETSARIEEVESKDFPQGLD